MCDLGHKQLTTIVRREGKGKDLVGFGSEEIMCSCKTANTKQLSEPEMLPTGPRSVNYRVNRRLVPDSFSSDCCPYRRISKMARVKISYAFHAFVSFMRRESHFS